MNKQQAQQIIRDTFESSFDKGKFTNFIINLLNLKAEQIEYKHPYSGNFIPDPYKQSISTLSRIAKYTDGEYKIDILIVKLKKETSLERARTMQRNFVAWYLNGSRGGEMKDAALAAFVSPDKKDWRFSLVKMDYKFEKTKTGRMKVKEEFTPARRWSFLVGANEKSHTAQGRLFDILANDEQAPTLEEIEKVFDIETVTKEFFLKYRELFMRTKEELDRVVKKDPKIKADFETKGVDTVNFAKKLLGQIVFLYFLQKKGWFGVARDDDWGTGSKQFLRELFEKKHGDYNNFFNDILEPLFYEALRRDRSEDDGYYKLFDCKIPFLNGGLFDPIGSDRGYNWVDTDILLPDKLFSNTNKTKEGDSGDGILDIFDRYNFTVKEDEPLEKEVAIDPELLGKSYEKFNAIRPDNFDEFKKALKSGKKGEENKFNKKFGVYYTPREIVHYMCQQSLINYLDATINAHKESIIKKPNVQKKLFGPQDPVQLTIFSDSYSPIIPKKDIEDLIHIGEHASENEALVLGKGKETKAYSHKLPESIRNNATLIDDKLADITVCDPAVGSGAFPVGMMVEIVRARNVLSTFIERDSRTPYEFKRRCIEYSLYGVDIDSGAVEIAKLRLWLSLIVDEDDIKNIKPLPNLDYKVVCGNSLLSVEEDLFNSHLFSELEKLKPLFFNETNPTKKQEYKKQIDKLISDITSGYTEFDFKVYFSEVFHHKGGFDVVIANPPYRVLTKNNTTKNEYNYYIKNYKAIKGSYSKNLFTLFIELSIELLRAKASLSYIIPEGLFKTRSYKGCVDLMEKEGHTKIIVTFTNYVFKNAVTGNLIFLFERGWKGETTYFHFNNEYELNKIEIKENKVISKIEKDSIPLKNIATMFKGMVIKDRDTVLSEQKRNYKNIFLLGKNISKWMIHSMYYTNYSNLQIIGGTKKISKHNQVPRILIRRTGDVLCCAYLEKPALTESTLYSCWSNSPEKSNKFLLCLLNSKVLDYYNQTLLITNQQGFPQILMTDLENLPIKNISNKEQKPFIKYADNIISITQSNDYSQNPKKQAAVRRIEEEIDKLVYKLYDLKPEEIKIVERGE